MTVRQDVGESARADRNPSIKAENYTNATNDGARHSTGKIADSADSDPDLPPFARRRIDEDTYLRLREEHIARLRGLEPDKPFDPAARGRAMQTMEDQQTRLRETANDFSLSSLIELAGAWNPIGPAPIPNGQVTGGSTSTPVSGRVTAIAVHPTNPNTIYLGTAQGGLWRSLDGGVSWTPLMDTAQSLAIGAVTIDPLNPTKVFVGTGEGNGSVDSFFGVGLYRIDNADAGSPVVNGPFETRVIGAGTGASNGHAFLGTAINKIVVDPANDNRIFVGNSLGGGGVSGDVICCGGTNPVSGFVGLYFSANALASTPTFSRVSVTTFNGVQAITDIVFEPGSSNNLLFGATDFSGGGLSGIYRMTDASTASQSPSTAPATTALVLSTPQRNIKFAINKVGATVTVLAATGEVDNAAGTGCATRNGVLRRSTDGGATWPTKLTAADGFCADQCNYDIGLATDPNDASKIYLGGSAEPSINNTCRRLYVRSTDGGTTFGTGVSTGLHRDVYGIIIAADSTSRIYIGNDGGVWSATDSGATWTSRNTAELNITQFESLALHPANANFTIGGSQDNGTEFRNAGGAWTRADFGDGGFSLIDQNAVNTTDVTMYHTYFSAKNSTIGYAQTDSTTTATDNGWSFRGCSNGTTPGNGINCTDDVLFYAPLARGPGNPNPISFGSDRLFRSSDIVLILRLVSQATV